MKKTLFVFWVLLAMVTFSSIASAYTYQNEPDGFREIKWGTEFDKVKDQLKFAYQDESYGGINIYTKIDDEMIIGAASLESVQYCFWQNKLAMAYINIVGINNWMGVQDALTYKFGQGFKNNRFIDDYTWVGATTVINSKYSDINKKGKITFLSWDLYHQMERWDREKAATGAKKGF